MKKIFAFSLAGLIISATAYSTPPQCPRIIGYHADNDLIRKAIATFSDMYERLGCQVQFRQLPARRSTYQFNASLIDGELYRFEEVEALYTKKFVRSKAPLLESPVSVWGSPDPHAFASKPLGYVRGYAWQENYAMHHANKPSIAYNNEEDLFTAYNKGVIGSLIKNDLYVHFLATDGLIKPRPVKVKTVNTRRFYHYLDAKFAPVMDQFSQILVQENNFDFVAKQ